MYVTAFMKHAEVVTGDEHFKGLKTAVFIDKALIGPSKG